MEVVNLRIARRRARELYREYKKHQHYSAPIDAEIRRAYQLIAQGRMVIRAIESIRTAGLRDGLPVLAICRADAEICHWRASHRRGEFLADDSWPRTNMSRSRRIPVAWDAVNSNMPNARAIVPLVPLHLRPKRALASYHILWEADWKSIPVDPLLVRRVGADMWAVVAAWDLTPVERAAMEARLSA